MTSATTNTTSTTKAPAIMVPVEWYQGGWYTKEEIAKFKSEQNQNASVSAAASTSSTSSASDPLNLDFIMKVQRVAHTTFSKAELELTTAAAAAAAAPPLSDDEFEIIPASDAVPRPIIVLPQRYWVILDSSTKDTTIGSGTYKKVVYAVNPLKKQIAALGYENLNGLVEPLPSLMRREVEIMQCVQDADYFVHLQDSLVTEDEIYIFMENCSGGNLDTAITGGNLKEQQRLSIAKQLAEALATLVQREILHRDIKPANIFLTQDYDVRLGDFGLACFMGDDDSRDVFYGTIDYFSPELAAFRLGSPSIQNDEIATNGPKADVWAMGMVYFQLLTGQPLLKPNATEKEVLRYLAHLTQYEMDDTIQAASERVHLSSELTSVLKGMLQVDPAKRLTAEQVQKAMEAITAF